MYHTYGGWFASAGNGLQGFQTPIKNDSFVVDGMGALGRVHSERGLTFYEVELSGHMCVLVPCPSALWVDSDNRRVSDAGCRSSPRG